MSWVEKIQRDLVITLGNGSVFTPNWMNATKEKEYNLTEFTFPEVSGSLVSRRRARGRRYTFELYFQGDDNLDLSAAFESGADDPRAWTISHPYYDRIIVQPVSLSFDNSKHNVTKITANVIETIVDENPKTSNDPTDKILSDVESLQPILSNAVVKDVIPNTADIIFMTSSNVVYFSEGSKIANNTIDFEDYFNKFNEAQSAIINATSEPLAAIRSIQAVINAPSLFITSVKSRIDNFLIQFRRLIESADNITDFSAKKLFENNGSAFISALINSSVTNVDYSNRAEVVDVIDSVISSYETLLNRLDSIQSENGSSPGSFVPDFDVQFSLNNLVNFAVSRLFEIAIEQRQERSIILTKDSNIIELTHQLLGLNIDDSNIDELVSTNNIGLDEILTIRKNREIIYFK